MKQKSTEELDAEVSALYEKYPFPSHPVTTMQDIYNTVIYRLIYSLTEPYLNKYIGKKAKILDVGCGTGELLLGIARSEWELVGVDQNEKSINEAQKRSALLNKNTVNFSLKDIIKDPIEENTYDLTYSIGVLHHLSSPQKAMEKLVRATKKGGYITVGLYNPFGRSHIRIHRLILNILAGNNIERRVSMAEKIFFKKKLEPSEKIFVADLYAHPREHYFSVEQMMHLFRENNVTVLSSTPPITIRQNFQLLKRILHTIRRGEKVDLIKSWQETVNIDNEIKNGKVFPLVTFQLQLVWSLLGMGEMVNMIGQKNE